MSSEEQLIEQVRRKFPKADGVLVGIGDDAAVLRPQRNKAWVITTDAFLENVHFLRHIHPPKAVGYKALARASSDLAAMGARPRFFLLTLALPKTLTETWLDPFLKGMALAARRLKLGLIGGDTSRYPSIVINLTVVGEVTPGQAILRSGARHGDLICVSGKLGEAELGLQLIQMGLDKDKRWGKMLRKHMYPQPRLVLGRWLAEGKWASAMIDTSDGLSTDLGHLCKASGVGARIFADKIPMVHVPQGLQRPGIDHPVQLAVNGGEDYELLFTVPKRVASRLPAKVGTVPLTIIGEATRDKKISLVDFDGRSRPLREAGWDPFRNRT